MDFDFDEPLETEEELRERYPHLYGGNEKPYEPPPIKLNAEQQAMLDKTRAEIVARNEVVEEHGENYHYIRKITDEMLPTVNFRRFDNLFLARPANAFLKANRRAKVGRRLFGDFWLEGEMTVLFGETGCGKSLLAMQIARSLTGGPRFDPFEMEAEPGRVGYFDFELNEDQFTKRYTSDAAGANEKDPFLDGLILCPAQILRALPPGFDSLHDFLIHSITQIVDVFDVKFVIIDNITWLSPNLESSPNAQRLMKTLVQLKKELKISILVLAHTKKRPPYQPIELAHINGSKMLSVFVESMFAIGASRRGKNIRYIKPLKHRYTPDRDAETEVASVRIGKEKNFLGFGFESLTDERSHIGWSYGHALQAEFAERVEQLAKEKMTQRAIAKELGVGPTTVNRCLKALRQKEAAKSL